MKVGLSYSRCVRDIFEKNVSQDQILVIVTRTNFDPNNNQQWKFIWQGYTTRTGFGYPEWAGYVDHEDEFKKITLDLWNQGKLHQPRSFGAPVYPYPTTNSIWFDLIQTDRDLEANPAAKKAFENYKLIAGLIRA